MSANESRSLTPSQHLKAHSIPRRQTHPTKEQNDNSLSTHVKEYAEASSIHGLSYITEDGRHPFER